jgi:hypothetical protein
MTAISAVEWERGTVEFVLLRRARLQTLAQPIYPYCPGSHEIQLEHILHRAETLVKQAQR